MQGLIRDDNETLNILRLTFVCIKRRLIRISHWRLISIIILKRWNI